MSPRSLAQWLAHIEALHPAEIEMGLDRVLTVAGRLGLEPPRYAPARRTVIVAGTNGKGSTCVFAEALLLAAGFRVGTTLSPHLHRFNERVRIDGLPVDDADLCAAFARVESARKDVPLTYFEYSALVALDSFRSAGVDVAVLEVGLGGRLDAFNLVSADVSVITSIGLDHQDFLGDELEGIGWEKAGVMRSGQTVVLGAEITQSVLDRAAELDCDVRRAGETFHVKLDSETWHYSGSAGDFGSLPWGRLAPENCALGIEVAQCFTVLQAAQVRHALNTAALPGRCDARSLGDRLLVLDVAHNPAGARFLRRLLLARYPGRHFVAVLGMLADKDAQGVVDALSSDVALWICVPTFGPRGQSAADLAARLPEGVEVETASGVSEALAIAEASSALRSHPEDGILALGSFSLVAQASDYLERHSSLGQESSAYPEAREPHDRGPHSRR